jgi:hypothetical protein
MQAAAAGGAAELTLNAETRQTVSAGTVSGTPDMGQTGQPALQLPPSA